MHKLCKTGRLRAVSWPADVFIVAMMLFVKWNSVTSIINSQWSKQHSPWMLIQHTRLVSLAEPKIVILTVIYRNQSSTGSIALQTGPALSG